MNTSNFRTKWLALLFAVANVAQPIVNNGNFDLKRDWLTLVGSVIAALWGYHSADKQFVAANTDAIKGIEASGK